jgi:hypothetical protein
MSERRRERHRRRLKERLMREGEIRRRAAFDGRQEVPPRDGGLSQTETWLIHEQFPAFERAERTAAGRRLNREKLRDIDNDLTQAETNFKALVATARMRASEILLNDGKEQALALASATEAGRELERFRSGNLLTRNARYKDPLLGIGCAVSVAALLTAVDGALFAGVTRWGLAGGALNAALLAAPTIVMGLGLGKALSAAGHVRRWISRAGKIAAGLLGTGIAGWAFYVGHLRALAEEALRRGEELTLLDAGVWTQMWSDPTRVFEAWPAVVLMVLQLAGAAVAVWDGYAGLSDSYPGYAGVDRRYRAAIDAVARREAEYVTAISKLAESAMFEIEERRRTYDRKGKEALAIITRAGEVVRQYDEGMLDFEWASAACVREYRELNARSRPAATVPARFSEPISLVRETPTPLGFDPEAVRKRVREGLAAAHKAADAAVAAIETLRLAFLGAAQGEGQSPFEEAETGSVRRRGVEL